LSYSRSSGNCLTCIVSSGSLSGDVIRGCYTLVNVATPHQLKCPNVNSCASTSRLVKVLCEVPRSQCEPATDCR